MPNIKSAIKRTKTAEKSRIANQAVKTSIATTRRRLYETATNGDKEESGKLFREYCSLLDKAVKSRRLTSGAAGRRKSRASARIAAIATVATEA